MQRDNTCSCQWTARRNSFEQVFISVTHTGAYTLISAWINSTLFTPIALL